MCALIGSVLNILVTYCRKSWQFSKCQLVIRGRGEFAFVCALSAKRPTF